MNNFQGELNFLATQLMTMHQLAARSLEDAVASVFNRDAGLAEIVLENEPSINQMELDIDALVLKLFALQQPVARDLRFILGAARINSNIERIGDEAVNIAERGILLGERPALPMTRDLTDLVALTKSLLAMTAKAVAALDADLAREICARNDEALHYSMRAFRALIELQICEQRSMERAFLLSMIAHSLKRVCDQCANISENVIFIKEAVEVKHAGNTPANA